ESQVFHRQTLVDELAKRVNPDAQVHFGEVRRHLLVAQGGFDAFRRHRLIGYQQQRAAGNLVVEPGDEYGRGFHVNGHAPDLTQILLQVLIVLPYAAVGGIDRAGPVVAPGVPDGSGDGLLQAEGGQRRDFRWEIIIRGALPANSRNRQDQIAQFVLPLQSAAFAEEQAGLGLDGAEQVHDGCRAGAAHAKVDDGDALARRVEHGPVLAAHRHLMPLGEQAHIVVEVDQQYVLPELLQRRAGVARQPVADDLTLVLHGV